MYCHPLSHTDWAILVATAPFTRAHSRLLCCCLRACTCTDACGTPHLQESAPVMYPLNPHLFCKRTLPLWQEQRVLIQKSQGVYQECRTLIWSRSTNRSMTTKLANPFQHLPASRTTFQTTPLEIPDILIACPTCMHTYVARSK